MAGLVYAYLNHESSQTSAYLAMSASRIALQSESTISDQMSEAQLLKTLKETYHV
jgi:sugar/nucleoside kinase (ribokinase family)